MPVGFILPQERRGPLLKTGGEMCGDIDMQKCSIKNLLVPTEQGDAANKFYVDNKYSYGTSDLEAGVSELESGKLYFVYE